MLRAVARRHRRGGGEDDMNITAFMNLMVILVPFLLITAVFSRLTILQLNLPGESTPTTQQTEEDTFEIIVRKDQLQVATRRTGLLKAIPNTPTGSYDTAELANYLKQLKARFPEKTDATVLVEADTSYDTVVQIMDAVRAYTVTEDSKSRMAELFPDISIGDAPT
jgi:biopolymer transport protein ExbD